MLTKRIYTRNFWLSQAPFYRQTKTDSGLSQLARYGRSSLKRAPLALNGCFSVYPDKRRISGKFRWTCARFANSCCWIRCPEYLEICKKLVKVVRFCVLIQVNWLVIKLFSRNRAPRMWIIYQGDQIVLFECRFILKLFSCCWLKYWVAINTYTPFKN